MNAPDDPLIRHVPELRQPARRAAALGIALACFAAASAALLLVDTRWPQWTLAGQAGVIGLGFLLAGQFFWRRREYRARYGERAYRQAFLRFMLPGLPLMFAAIFHTLYLPGERLWSGPAALAAVLLGVYLALTGGLLYVRAYQYFGTDNLSMLYVYFPAEGRMVSSAIYAVLRHPAYSGAVRLGLAFGLWRGTPFSLLFGLFMPIGLTFWLRLAEEPELIERFGAGYAEYRRRVPAFWPRPRDLRAFSRGAAP